MSLKSGSPNRVNAQGRAALPARQSASLTVATVIGCATLVLRPPGIVGVVIALIATVLAATAANRDTVSVYLLSLGPPTAGLVMRAFGLPIPGSVISFIVGAGLTLLSVRRPRALRSRESWMFPALWLGCILLVIGGSYLRGPQTAFAINKLAATIAVLALYVFVFRQLVCNPLVDARVLGVISILGAVCYYACFLHLVPDLRPESLLTFGGARLRGADTALPEWVSFNALGSLTTFGLAVLLGGTAGRAASRSQLVQVGLSGICAVLIIVSAGQRLFIGAVPICLLSVLACRPKNTTFARSMAACSIVVLLALGGAAVARGNKLVDAVFRADTSFADRANRGENWESALHRIEEEPLLGHGLGGYYVDGMYGVEGVFPHDIVLELWSEAGLVGLAIVLAPALISVLRRRAALLPLRCSGGAALLPLFAYLAVHSLISDDLRQSSRLLALWAAAWASTPIASASTYRGKPSYSFQLSRIEINQGQATP